MVPEQKIGTTDLAQALAVASLHLDVTSYLSRTKGVLAVSWYTSFLSLGVVPRGRHQPRAHVSA